MQQTQNRRGATKLGFAVAVLLTAAAAGAWAMSTVFASKPTTVGDSAVAEASAPISPMDLMITHGRYLPVSSYVEPF